MKRAALGILVFAGYLASVQGQSPSAEEKKATVAYLLMLQQPDGSFGVAAKGEPNSGDIQSTSSALRALKYFGGAVKDPKVTSKFVQSCFDKSSGEIGLRPNDTRNVFTTSVGLMAMVEL